MKTLRTVVMSFSLWGLAVFSTSTTAESAAAHKIAFRIDAPSMTQALLQFTEQANLQLAFTGGGPEELAAPKVVGRYTPREALEQLLAQTGLTYEFINERTVRISSISAISDAGSALSALPLQEGAALKMAQADNNQVPAQSATNQTNSAVAATDGEKGRTIEEIIVTAQKRAERLQDVPVPVAVINTAALTKHGQLRLEDYYATVPGLGLVHSGNGGAPSLSIRGISALSDSNPAVGIMVDDVPFGAAVNPGTPPIVADIDPGDLARIELLRGPQGTLYGASSIGGILKFVTVAPSTEELSGGLQVGGTSVEEGDELGHNYRGWINAPLSDTFAVRASAFAVVDPGYIDNVLTGEDDINRREASGGRLAALWRPTETFSLNVSGQTQDSDRQGYGGVNQALYESSNGELQHSGVRGTGVYERHSEVYSATVSLTLGAFQLTSLTGYSRDEEFTNLDSTFFCGAGFDCLGVFGVTAASTPFAIDSAKLTQEIRATTSFGNHVTWLIGGFYNDEDLSSANDVNALDPTIGENVGSIVSGTSDSAFNEQALFTNVAVNFTESFDVQFGARYSENELTNSIVRGGALFGGNPPPVPTVNTEDNSTTYLVAPRYRFSPDAMVYARASSGYRPGGANNCARPGVPCSYGPDTTVNYEIGFKGEAASGFLTYDISLYHIDWDKIQVRIQNAQFRSFIGNSGAGESEGVELSLTARPTTGLEVAGWVAVGKARLTEVIAGFPGYAAEGEALPNSSKESAYIALDYDLPIGSAMTASFGGAVTYVGDRLGPFRAAPGLARTTYPSYTQLSLDAGVEIGSWELTAFINNATDKRTPITGDPEISGDVFLLQPRTFGINVSKTF